MKVLVVERIVQALPDAVVLDVGLPGIDGLEVCRRVRRLGNRVPILILTARAEVDDRIDGLEVGADDYMVKPFDVVELARGATRDGPADDVRLDEVVQGTVASARRRGGVSFELTMEPTMVLGQADRIGRAVSNLIDDSRKWSPAGLAIVRRAAEACGGFADAQNAPGGGALLRVSFGEPVPFAAKEGAGS